jgi:hypothetical protein
MSGPRGQDDRRAESKLAGLEGARPPEPAMAPRRSGKYKKHPDRCQCRFLAQTTARDRAALGPGRAVRSRNLNARGMP